MGCGASKSTVAVFEDVALVSPTEAETRASRRANKSTTTSMRFPTVPSKDLPSEFKDHSSIKTTIEEGSSPHNHHHHHHNHLHNLDHQASLIATDTIISTPPLETPQKQIPTSPSIPSFNTADHHDAQNPFTTSSGNLPTTMSSPSFPSFNSNDHHDPRNPATTSSESPPTTMSSPSFPSFSTTDHHDPRNPATTSSESPPTTISSPSFASFNTTDHHDPNNPATTSSGSLPTTMSSLSPSSTSLADQSQNILCIPSMSSDLALTDCPAYTILPFDQSEALEDALLPAHRSHSDSDSASASPPTVLPHPMGMETNPRGHSTRCADPGLRNSPEGLGESGSDTWTDQETVDCWGVTRDEHEGLLQSMCAVHVERPGSFAAIDARVDGMDGVPVCVTGQSGCGKTALLANWIHHRRQGRSKEFIFVHFVSKSSNHANSIISRFFGDAAKAGSPTADLFVKSKDDDPGIESSFKTSLRAVQVELGMPVVIVIDGLDQVATEGMKSPYGWLPATTAPRVQLVCSCADGPALDHVRSLGWATHEVPELCQSERRDFVQAYVGAARLNLPINDLLNDQVLLRQVEENNRCANPLFLRLVLEEVAVASSTETVRRLLACDSPTTLSEEALSRLEAQHSCSKDLLSFMSLARLGLTEAEARDFVGCKNDEDWSRLFGQLRRYLVSKGSLYVFFHEVFAEVVAKRYDLDLPVADSTRQTHLKLANLFLAHGSPRRILQERPWHLLRGKAYEELESFLREPSVAVKLYKLEGHELFQYWTAMGADPSDVYKAMTQALLEEKDFVGRLRGKFGGTFRCLLHDLKAFKAEEAVCRAILDSVGGVDECGDENHDVMYGLANAVRRQGRYEEAMELYMLVMGMRERLLGCEHVEMLTVMNNLALTLNKQRMYDQAKELQLRVVRCSEKVFGPEHPDTLADMHNLSCTIQNQGMYEAACSLQKKVLGLREKVLGEEHPDTLTTMASLAVTYQRLGRCDEAKTLEEGVLNIRERVFGVEHPDTLIAMCNLSFTLQELGEYAAADRLLQKALPLHEVVFGGAGVSRVRGGTMRRGSLTGQCWR